MSHSKCSIEIISLYRPEWPSDPRAVTGVILLSLPQGLQQNIKTTASPQMSRKFLSGPDPNRQDWPQATAAFPVPSWPLYKKFRRKHTKKREENKNKVKWKSCPHQEGLRGRGQRAGSRDSQAAVGIGDPEPQQTVPSAQGTRKQRH